MESENAPQEVTFLYDDHGEKIKDETGRVLVRLASGKTVYAKILPTRKSETSVETTIPDDMKNTKKQLPKPRTTKRPVIRTPITKPRLPWNDDSDRIITTAVSEFVKGSDETDTAAGKKSFKQGAKIWSCIAAKVNAQGHDFTAEQCRGRYNTIVAAFRRIEEEKSKDKHSRVRASTSHDVLEIVRNITEVKEDDTVDQTKVHKRRSISSANKSDPCEHNLNRMSSKSDAKSPNISCVTSSTLAKEVKTLREQHIDMHKEKMMKLDALIEENKRTNEERKRTNELLAEHNQLLYQLLGIYKPNYE